jgi:uncharacterized protein YjiS (DUF1127 family)
MTIAPIDAPATVGPDSARGRTAFATRLVAILRRWRRRARNRDELRRLDERLLADAGIAVGEADFEAAKPFWME